MQNREAEAACTVIEGLAKKTHKNISLISTVDNGISGGALWELFGTYDLSSFPDANKTKEMDILKAIINYYSYIQTNQISGRFQRNH